MLSSIMVRRLTADDYEAFRMMDTGIEDDYVIRIFPDSVEHEATFGVFYEERLVSIAAYTLFAHKYAVLGRVRTDRRYRGQGLSTKLLAELCRMVDKNEQIEWVGLATELNNRPMLKIAEKLGFSRLSIFTSNILTGQVELPSESQSTGWDEVVDLQAKREFLRGMDPAQNPLHFFPYECYYPLPFEEPLWTDDYINNCRLFARGNRFVLLMKDQKGRSYLHVKYFFDDFFLQPGLFRLVVQEAEKQEALAWIDLPEASGLPNQYKSFFDTVAWTCWGRMSPRIG